MKARIIAPSWKVNRLELTAAIDLLPEWLECRYEEELFKEQMNLAGSDERRIRELHEAFTGDEDIIWAARGGYGVSRLLPLIIIPSGKKTVIGFSDFSMIGYLSFRQGHRFIYGPMPHTFSHQKKGLETLLSILQGNRERKALLSGGVDIGQVKGRAEVFCLKMLINSLSTPYQPRFDESTILFIEDVDERAYAIERDLVQLKYSGILNGIRGVVFNFHSVKGRKEADPEQWMKEHFPVPVLGSMSFGHCSDAEPVIYNEEIIIEKNTVILSPSDS